MIIRPYSLWQALGLYRYVANLLGLWLVALLAVGLLPSPAWAQGIEGLETQSRQGRAGPYSVAADARELPSLQSVQFFIKVTDSAGAPAEGMQVTVHTSRRGGDETGWAHAFSPNEPGLYQATVALEEPGVWEMLVEVTQPDGVTFFMDGEGFVFTSVAATTNAEAGYVFVGVAVILAAGAGYLVWRVRKNQRQRAEQSGGTVA